MTSSGAQGKDDGRLFVVSGPSGVGKMWCWSGCLHVYQGWSAVSARPPATRDPARRTGWTTHFLTREQFEAGIAQGVFFEYAMFNDHYYGTPRDKVALQRAEGVDVILKIEVQGAEAVRRLAPDAILVLYPAAFAGGAGAAAARPGDGQRKPDRRAIGDSKAGIGLYPPL